MSDADTGESAREPCSGYWRWLSLLGAAACIAGLAVGVFVRPDPAGLGSHTYLGFQPCGFLQYYGWPCASCGMTTSFAWFVRGNFLASLYVQPAGFFLALLAVLGALGGVYQAFSGKWVLKPMFFWPWRKIALVAILMALAGWGWKAYIYSYAIDGWN